MYIFSFFFLSHLWHLSSCTAYLVQGTPGSWKSLNLNVAKSRPWKYLEIKVVLEKSWKMFRLVWKILLHNWTAHKCYCELLKHCHSVDYLLMSRRSNSHSHLVNVLRWLRKVLEKSLQRSLNSKASEEGYPASTLARVSICGFPHCKWNIVIVSHATEVLWSVILWTFS